MSEDNSRTVTSSIKYEPESIEPEIPEEPEEQQYMDYLAKEAQKRMDYLDKLDQQRIEHQNEQELLEDLRKQEPEIPETPEETPEPEFIGPEQQKYIKDYFITDQRCYLKLRSGPTKYFVLDRHLQICEIVTITKGEKDEDNTITKPRKEGRRELQAHFSIGKLIIYPSIPELNNPEMYSFNVNTKDKKFKIGPATLDEIVGELRSRGLFYYNNRAMDITTNAINALRKNDQYRLENSSPYPGFFILNGEFKSTIEYFLPSKEQLAEALTLLNEFGRHYGDFGPKLGYICHWNIIAPFSYVLKQKGVGNKINNLLLYGTTRTGKSTIAKLSGYIWNLDLDSQTYSGSMVHSVYQYGVAISKSTYPIIVDEGEILYDDFNLASMLKTATHSLKARARYNNFLQKQEEVNALSPAIITSNYSKPNDGALGARIDLLEYTAKDVRGKEARDKFNQKFEPEKTNGPLKVLRFIGDYVAAKVIEDPGILDEDWVKAAHKLFEEMYTYAGVEMPEWLKEHAYPDGVEKSFEDEQSYIISNIKGLILRRAEPTRHKDEEPVKTITNKMKANDVVNQSREPWIYCHNPRSGTDAGKKFVWIEKGIETDLKKEKGLNITLDRIAELLGGKVMRKTTRGRSKINVAVFDYDKFLDQF